MLPLPRIESRKIYKTRSNDEWFIECASLNKSSLQSFASGDENGTIKIWKIGDDEFISSFESNLAITCIAFNNNNNNNDEKDKNGTNDNKINNNLLVSGNIGGGIKLYDLNENKLIRNYGGHRCQVSDINFFDFNNGTTLIISCSADSNVKIWDIRSKTNVLTFKGHTNTVNCIDFSPDGNWIVSADCIGHTKLWDISTSKCIHQFHDKQSINDILFHPEELVLATAAGKVVRFWDLETMQHITRTSKVTTPIKKIIFPQNIDIDNQLQQQQQFIISASNQSLRIWQWDPLPVYCRNNISVHWNNKIDDIKQIKGYNDLICLECDKNKVIVWLTDLGQVFGNNHDDDNNDDDDNDDDTYNDDEFEEIDDEDIPFNDNDNDNDNDDNNDDTIDVPDGLKNMPQEMWTKSFFEAAEIVRKQRTTTKRKKIIPKKTKKLLTKPIVKKINITPSSNAVFIANKQLKRSPLKDEGNDTNITNINNDECSENNKNLKFAQFIPKHLVDYDERELIKIKRSMMTEHIPILRTLSSRLRYLRQLKSLWKKKKLNEFIEILKQIQNDNECGNNTIFISFIQSILNDISTKSFSFRFCHLLLSIIDLKKLDINNQTAIIIILTYIHYILQTFSSLITQTLKMEILNEKDLNMIDRRQHCQNGHELLTKNIKQFIIEIQQQHKENIKIDELCNRNLTLIQLL